MCPVVLKLSVLWYIQGLCYTHNSLLKLNNIKYNLCGDIHCVCVFIRIKASSEVLIMCTEEEIYVYTPKIKRQMQERVVKPRYSLSKYAKACSNSHPRAHVLTSETEGDWKNDCALIYKSSLSQLILKGKKSSDAHHSFFAYTSNITIAVIATP